MGERTSCMASDDRLDRAIHRPPKVDGCGRLTGRPARYRLLPLCSERSPPAHGPLRKHRRIARQNDSA